MDTTISVGTGHAPSLHLPNQNLKSPPVSGFGFLFLFLHLIVCLPSFAQEESKYGMNGSWKLDGDRVKITYELFLPLDRTYDVQVVLKKEGDSTFSIIPKTIEGAIGRIQYTGGRLEINWDYKKDIQGELEGKFRFDFDVKEVVEESGWKWWHYAAGGAAVLVGTIVAINAGTKDNPPTGLPGPPRIRP